MSKKSKLKWQITFSSSSSVLFLIHEYQLNNNLLNKCSIIL